MKLKNEEKFLPPLKENLEFTEEMLNEAKEVANSLQNITDIKCPRDVINPGLYFGFILGYLKAKKKETSNE